MALNQKMMPPGIADSMLLDGRHYALSYPISSL
jgi:hypothetical protein